MSEFDKLKDYAQQHPQQVEKGEQAVEKELGIQQQDEAQQGQADTAGGSDPARDPADQRQ